MVWDIFKKLFGKKVVEPVETPLVPESIENLPAADDAVFYRDSKRLLQRFDEYITAAEVESESLCIELDDTLDQQEKIKTQLRTLNKPGSWQERNCLLRLDRLTLYSDGLKQRIEIYAQNIKVYLNLIAKIQDIKAMRMNGLDEERIETIWLEFKDTVEEYQRRLRAEESGFKNEVTTSPILEGRLKELRAEILPDEPVEIASEIEKESESEPEAKIQRPSLEELLSSHEEEDEDGYEDGGREPMLECS